MSKIIKMVTMVIAVCIAASLRGDGTSGLESSEITTNAVSLSEQMSSYCGFKFGAPGSKKAEAEYFVKLAKPFRYFKEASLYFTKDTFLLKKVDLRCKLPDSSTIDDGVAEVSAIKRIFEKKYNITITSSRDDGFEYKTPDVTIYCYLCKRDLDMQLTVTNLGAVRKAAKPVQVLSSEEGIDTL